MIATYHRPLVAPSATGPDAQKPVALRLRNTHGLIDAAFSAETFQAELSALEATQKYPRNLVASGGLDMQQLATAVRQHQFQAAQINQLAPGSWTGERITVVFSQLTSALEHIPMLLQQAANAEIITRSSNFEAIHAYMIVFFWYDDAGPSLASCLCQQYEDNGPTDLISAHPSTGKLINHLFRYAKLVRCHKGALSDDIQELQQLPSDLYGLVPSSSCSAQLSDYGKCPRTLHAISPWVQKTFLDLISREVIIPSVRSLDAHLALGQHSRSGKRSTSYDSIRARLVITGATISRVVHMFNNNDSILASLRVQELVLRPTQLFDLTGLRETALEMKILQDPDAMFKEWDRFLAAVHVEDVLPVLAEQIADLMWARLTAVTSAQKPSKLQPTSRPAAFFAPARVRSSAAPARANIVDPPLSVDSLIGNSNHPCYAMAAIVLHDVLAKRRNLPFYSDYLARIMQGLRPTGGNKPSSDYDADHCNPVRYNNLNTQLLRERMSPDFLTTEFGISSFLVWMTTGQGNMTSRFARQTNMMFTDLATCVSAFESATAVAQKCTNCKIWGKAPCNWLNLTHKSGFPTAEDKFAPLFERDLQRRWIRHLGNLAHSDPTTYTGPKMSWSHMLNWIRMQSVNCLKGASLTLLQTANNLALLGLCQEPTAEEMGDFLAQVGGGQPPKKRKTQSKASSQGTASTDKGGFKGLLLLGYRLTQRQNVGPWIKAAFLSFYHHLDKHLSVADKAELHFGAMFAEHLLCKVSRFQSLFVNDAGAREVTLETLGQAALNTGWDDSPLPLQGDRDDVKRAIDSVLASRSCYCDCYVRH